MKKNQLYTHICRQIYIVYMIYVILKDFELQKYHVYHVPVKHQPNNIWQNEKTMSAGLRVTLTTHELYIKTIMNVYSFC